MKRGHVTIWGSCRNVLWCRVAVIAHLLSRVQLGAWEWKSAYMFEKLASWTWTEAIRGPQHRCYKCECPLTSERQCIHQALPQSFKYCLCKTQWMSAGRDLSLESYTSSIADALGMGSEPSGGCPTWPWHTAASFPVVEKCGVLASRKSPGMNHVWTSLFFQSNKTVWTWVCH